MKKLVSMCFIVLLACTFLACNCEHEWGGYSVSEAENCLDTAQDITYVCSLCGKTKTVETYAPGPHTWDDGVLTKEPTCGDNIGIFTYTCTLCGETKTEERVASIAHTRDEGTVILQPIYSVSGEQIGVMEFIEYRCTVCGYTWPPEPLEPETELSVTETE